LSLRQGEREGDAGKARSRAEVGDGRRAAIAEDAADGRDGSKAVEDVLYYKLVSRSAYEAEAGIQALDIRYVAGESFEERPFRREGEGGESFREQIAGRHASEYRHGDSSLKRYGF
jgi:hypothetical protein